MRDVVKPTAARPDEFKRRAVQPNACLLLFRHSRQKKGPSPANNTARAKPASATITTLLLFIEDSASRCRGVAWRVSFFFLVDSEGRVFFSAVFAPAPPPFRAVFHAACQIKPLSRVKYNAPGASACLAFNRGCARRVNKGTPKGSTEKKDSADTIFIIPRRKTHDPQECGGTKNKKRS